MHSNKQTNTHIRTNSFIWIFFRINIYTYAHMRRAIESICIAVVHTLNHLCSEYLCVWVFVCIRHCHIMETQRKIQHIEKLAIVRTLLFASFIVFPSRNINNSQHTHTHWHAHVHLNWYTHTSFTCDSESMLCMNVNVFIWFWASRVPLKKVMNVVFPSKTILTHINTKEDDDDDDGHKDVKNKCFI